MERKYPQLNTNLAFTDLSPNLVKTLHEKGINYVEDLLKQVYQSNKVTLNDLQTEEVNNFFKRHYKEIFDDDVTLPYHFRFINNHIVVEFPEGQFLLDTGSPKSYILEIGYLYIDINGISYPLEPMLGLDVKKIYNHIHFDIKGIIGLDILKKTNFTIVKRDESGGDLYFSAGWVYSKQYPLKSSYHYIKIDASINGRPVVYLVDTGANITYVRKGFLRKANQQISEVKDYSPVLGDLKSDLYKAQIKINNKTYDCEVAVNKRVEEYALDSTDSDVIGSILPLLKKEIVFNLHEGWVAIK